MKKLSLLLVIALLLTTFVACGNNESSDNAEETEETTPVETVEEQEEEKPEDDGEKAEADAEADKEEDAEEEYVPSVETVKPENVEVGPIAKIGLGSITSTNSSKDAADDKPAKAQADVTIAAVAFDADGKIVEAKLDVAQTSVNFNEDNTNADFDPEAEIKTKMEKGAEYDMKKASPIEKEFDEQLEAFMDYIVGMTAEEVANIPTRAKDDHHQHVPDVADMLTSTTIDIGAFLHAVEEAWNVAVDAEGATKLGLGIETSISGKEAADKPARAQINTYMNALGLDDEGVIVANYVDVVQAKIDVDADGKIVERQDAVKSKKELADDYGMRKASEIGREWYEQMADFQEFTIGKTVEEVLNIPVKVRDENHQHVPDLPELESSVTISVEGYQSVIEKAAANAQ